MAITKKTCVVVRESQVKADAFVGDRMLALHGKPLSI